MPRKSTASALGAADPSAHSATSSAAAPSKVDGDMTVATDTSPNSKPPKTSTRADKGDADHTGIDDLLLPRTLTSRLARGTLPPNTSIQKDALLALTKAASVFVSYLASHANEVTTKKTIGPSDVIKAIQEIEMGGVMGLGDVGPDGKAGGRLERELEVWETVVRGKRKGYREKVKMRESGVRGGSSENGGGGKKEEHGGDEGGEREAKRAKVEDGAERLLRTEDYHGSASLVEQQARAAQNPERRPQANGASKDQAGDETEDEEDDDDVASADGDETQSDGEGDPENEEEPALDEEELDGYGPDDQLRHDMNGDETEDDSE